MPSTKSTSALVALTGLLTVLSSLKAVAGVNYFISAHQNLALARIDPIVNPGVTSKHVHKFVGANTLDSTVTYKSLRAATTTTAEVTDDHSLYWQPTLYWRDGSGKFHLMQEDHGLAVYWFGGRLAPGESLTDMPGGLRMTAGDPTRTTYDPNNLEDAHMGFSCYCMGLEGSTCNVPAGSPAQFKSFDQVKDFACDVVRIETMFPSCWDSRNLDSDDHKSHMAYSADNLPCPASHPLRIPTTFLEGWYYTDKTNWPQEGELVLSTGDTTGYSIHGDFFNGWSEGQAGVNGSSILVKGLNNCPEMNGNAASCSDYNVVAPPTVTPVKAVTSEEVGRGGVVLDKLPGDVALWGADGSAPAAPVATSSAAQTPAAGQTSAAPTAAIPASSASGAASYQVPADESTPVAQPVVTPANPNQESPVVSKPVVAVPTTTVKPVPSVSTRRSRGGGRHRTTPAVNNAHAAVPSSGIMRNNLVAVNGTATEPAQGAVCSNQKRAVRARAQQQL